MTKKVPLLCFEWAAETMGIAIRSLSYLESLGFTEFAIQNGDNYLFRPNQFTDSQTVSAQLSTATA